MSWNVFKDIVQIGGELLGLDRAEDAEDAANQRAQQNIDMQREFAQHGITWRVEDAQAAGLHPLFALGGGGAAFSPNPIGIDTGQSEAISRAAQAVGRTGDWKAKELALEAAAAGIERDRAQAEMFRSEAARMRQAANATKPAVPDIGGPTGWVPDSMEHQGRVPGMAAEMQPFFDRRLLKPREVTSASSEDWSETAGSSPHWDVFRLSKDGMMIQLPAGTGPAEAYESMAESKALLGFVLARNVEKYGAKWMVEFLKKYGHLFKWD